jgi:uncharacterized protein
VNKLDALRARINDLKQIVVCFSGGVDSTLLLKVAKEELGGNVLAVTIVSELFPRNEQEESASLAQSIGVGHLKIKGEELANTLFTVNPENRCYHCKNARFRQIWEIALERGIEAVTDGTNHDDIRDYRPGIQANREQGIISPLCEVGLNKDEIRKLSRSFGLPTWDKPALACLASRIAYHQTITAEKLKQVEAGERYLRGLNLMGDIRVRHHGPTARLEVDPEEISILTSAKVRNPLTTYFKFIGFDYVAVDLQGYIRGSLNRLILDD